MSNNDRIEFTLDDGDIIEVALPCYKSHTY